jgi:hypothetical protein
MNRREMLASIASLAAPISSRAWAGKKYDPGASDAEITVRLSSEFDWEARRRS